MSFKPKNIAVDYRSVLSQKTGKEWYTFSLLQELFKQDTKNTYYLYSKYDFDDTNLPQNCQKRIITSPLCFWHVAVMMDMFRIGIDMYLATASYIIASFLVSPIQNIKTILTVHDLVAFLYPEKHDIKARIIEKITASLAFKNSHTIICPSLSTKEDLEKLFAFTRKKTLFIPEAARSIFKKIDITTKQAKAILSKYQLPQKYILNIGTLSPRKNITSLLKSYFLLPEEIKAIYSLVIVGKKGWYYKEIFETVHTLNLEHHVVFTDYVDDYDLPYILSRASLFVYPSKYEGFGLPLLEAMACEVPIISSHTKALLEVGQDACHIVDPEDHKGMAKGVLKVLGNKEYASGLVKKGIKKYQEYSWETAAKETLAIIKG